ncbi:MAG: hypothetical protein GKR86_01000 [Ilumatobacter sp.]|nr:hypothetical protein [Ilumatobacter sp.]
MKVLINSFAVAALITSLGGSAEAFGTKNENNNTNQQGQVQGQAQGQIAIGKGGKGGAGGAGGGGGAGGNVGDTTTGDNTNNLSITDSGRRHYSGTTTVKSAPDVSAPGMFNTAPCMVSWSGGASIIGGGLSLGGGKMDEECNLRQEAAALVSVAGSKAGVLHLARDPEMCATLRSAGNIPADSICSEKERKAAASGSDVSRVSTRSTASARVPYTKCAVRSDGAIGVRKARGFTFEVAKAACLASLGY